jgi:hypothetical protein
MTGRRSAEAQNLSHSIAECGHPLVKYHDTDVGFLCLPPLHVFLEMASRCVVEMGTACYYTTLFRASPDPVLALLARRIADDEVRHYKHFYRYFRNYRDAERPGRAKVVPALWRRLRMTGGDDSFIVLKHVYGAHRPGESFDIRVYRSVRREGRDLVRDHFPHEMSVRMLFKPLALGPRTLRAALPVAVAIARRLVP